jgi:hypothetical protein
MPDIADMADGNIALELQSNLHAAKKRLGPQLAPIGACHNCEADLEAGKLFCAPVGEGLSECQVDYERRVKRGVS